MYNYDYIEHDDTLDEINIQKNIKKKNNKYITYCSNCGRNDHIFKNCAEAVLSYGIILVKLDDNNIKNKLLNLDKFTSSSITFNNDNDLRLFGILKNNIKFLMIRRKNTLGYIEFVRGHYNLENIDGIIFLFKQMIQEEIDRIKVNSFEDLWKDLWSDNKKKSLYYNEYQQSKSKFERLQTNKNVMLPLSFYVDNVKPAWDIPEWGFPKGRRNFQETDRECAIREFREETNLYINDYNLFEKLSSLNEKLIGTNGINYEHVYYLGLSDDIELKLDPNNQHQINEIGSIGWFTIDEAINLIRPYHIDRRRILCEIFAFLINEIINLSNL